MLRLLEHARARQSRRNRLICVIKQKKDVIHEHVKPQTSESGTRPVSDIRMWSSALLKVIEFIGMALILLNTALYHCIEFIGMALILLNTALYDCI